MSEPAFAGPAEHPAAASGTGARAAAARAGDAAGDSLEELGARFSGCKVIRRTGGLVRFKHGKIGSAVHSAFVAVDKDLREKGKEGIADIDAAVSDCVCRVLVALWARHERETTTTFAIEEIQDQVELALSRLGHHRVCSAYHAYRESHAEARKQKARSLFPETFSVRFGDGSTRMVEPSELHQRIDDACGGLPGQVKSAELLERVVSSLHDGISEADFDRVPVLEAATLIEKHHGYSKVAARLLMDVLVKEVMDRPISRGEMARVYPKHFDDLLATGIREGRLNPGLRSRFDTQRLGAALHPERDDQLDFLGLQTLYDRYFIKTRAGGRRLELPQSLWMRVAMGLALEEDRPTERAIEFYEVLSSFRFMNSTPTLFNSGTTFSQMSSCYITSVPDDLDGIFSSIKDNAMLQKFAGGLGNDWTRVRAMGSYIESTGGNSQGVVPFLRIANDTAVAVNQGGKRKGAVCSYLQTWHKDVEEFLELRKNTGDERRRTHDMNTANWIPDLFMRRVSAKGHWTLFSPSDVPGLAEKYGREFAEAYEGYEERFEAGELPGRRVEAFDLWRKMIGMLYETGHPWITFKDPCNVRSPQRHAGVVRSSNLCTEITLNTGEHPETGENEIAVCNLGSVNLARHVDDDGRLDEGLIKETVTVAMRMLDNVIDLNYYSVEAAARTNKTHRPVGLGQVGFQDCLYKIGVPFDSDEAVSFADRSTELIAFNAYWASSDLAAERGRYDSYEGSLWSQGKLPLDTLRMLAEERHGEGGIPEPSGGWLRVDGLEVNVESRLDWEALRKKIERDGMRNSNCLAIAPTATIGNIMGASPCIEPTYKNLFVKSNLSGEFKMINPYLVDDLVEEGLWDDVMISQIIANDGEIASISSIPAHVRARPKTCFKLDQRWLVEAASRRQKWIDQSQSLNLFMQGLKGSEISDVYLLAWMRGLKTTYYCRTLSAGKTEKFSTLDTGELNQVARATTVAPAPANGASAPANGAACALGDEECEVCQ